MKCPKCKSENGSQKEMRRQSLRTRPYVSARTAATPGTPKG